MSQNIKLKRSSVQGKTPTTSDLELGELAINTYDGKLFLKKDDGSESIVDVTSSGGGGGGGISWIKKTANYTASSGDHIIADTSGDSPGNPFTITLPATPSIGNFVKVADGDDWSANNLTVARNGSTIEGLSEDLVVDIKMITVELIYDGTTWEVFTSAVPQVPGSLPNQTGNSGKFLTTDGTNVSWDEVPDQTGKAIAMAIVFGG